MKKFLALILTVFAVTACGPSETDVHNRVIIELQSTYDKQGELLDAAFAAGPEVAPDVAAVKKAAESFEKQADAEVEWFTNTEFPEDIKVYQDEYMDYYLPTVDDYVALATVFVEDLEGAEDTTAVLIDYVGPMTDAESAFVDAFNRLGDTINANATE